MIVRGRKEYVPAIGAAQWTGHFIDRHLYIRTVPITNTQKP